jgi:hypothetical protein
MWTTSSGHRAQAKGATFVPTYRVNYERVRHTLCVNVEAGSKNAAAEIVRAMEESRIGVGKYYQIVVAHVEQYFNRDKEQYFNSPVSAETAADIVTREDWP